MTSGRDEHQQIVVALEIARMRLEALAAEIGLAQPVPLDHRPHRAVEDEDPARQHAVEKRFSVLFLRCRM